MQPLHDKIIDELGSPEDWGIEKIEALGPIAATFSKQKLQQISDVSQESIILKP